jgi:hypothetical protein
MILAALTRCATGRHLTKSFNNATQEYEIQQDFDLPFPEATRPSRPGSPRKTRRVTSPQRLALNRTGAASSLGQAEIAQRNA